MSEVLRIPKGITLEIQGDLNVRGQQSILPRSRLQQDPNKPFPVDLASVRVWDAFQTVLPGTPAADDLGLVGGTFGTDVPALETGDLKAAGATTRYGRFQVAVPIEYDSGQTILLRVSGGMDTTVSDNTATVDVEAYKSNRDGAKTGADLCTTAAQDINSLVFADKDFTLDEASISPGDILDVRVAVAVNDAATGTAVVGRIGAMELVCDVRG